MKPPIRMTKPYIRMTKTLICTLIACLAISQATAATTESGDSLSGQFALNTIVVTGTRTPKLLKDSPIQTRVITSEEIRQADATNIQELLQQELPGVEFSYAMSQQENMNLSGFSGQNVLILIDGERLAGETLDNLDFQRITMQGVERIEIIKGAASALYGSSANGGVINIITKEEQKPWQLNLNARLADHKEQRYGAIASFKAGRLANTFDLQHSRIDTYTLCLDTKDDCAFRTVYGGRTWNARERLTFQPMQGMKLTARAGYFFRERELDEAMPDRYRAFSAGLRADWDITKGSNLQLAYNFDQYDKSTYNTQKNLDIRNYNNAQNSLRLLYSRQTRQQDMLTIGGDIMRDYLSSYQFSGQSHSQQSGDIFAQYDMALAKHWEAIGAARWDYISDHHTSHATAKAGFRYTPLLGTQGHGILNLRGGYSGGFRAPSLKEKYMRQNILGVFDILGTPNLKPEKSHNLNLSAEYTKGHYNITIASNYSIVTDKLAYTQPTQDAANPALRTVRYINLPRMRVFSLEATAQGRHDIGLRSMLGLRVSYNYTHEETSHPNINMTTPARPHSLLLKTDWDKQFSPAYALNLSLTGRIHSSVTYTCVDMEPPFPLYEVHNPAYTIWKLQLINRLPRGVNITVAIDNLFNYSPRTYYLNSPITLGTNLMVGLSLDIDKLF